VTPLEALQSTLAGEYAAIYVYGVLGGRVSASEDPALAGRLGTAYTTHRGRRDSLISMIYAKDGEPVASEVSYALPNPATRPAQLIAAALETEQRSCAVYADMVGNTSGPNREWAVDALNDAAVRLLGFDGTPEAFPGIGEL